MMGDSPGVTPVIVMFAGRRLTPSSKRDFGRRVTVDPVSRIAEVDISKFSKLNFVVQYVAYFVVLYEVRCTFTD